MSPLESPLTFVSALWAGAVASTALWAGLRSRETGEARGARDARDARDARGTRGEAHDDDARAKAVGRVLVLRPCAGAERGLARALASTTLSARGLDARVRFAVATEGDLAAPEAERAAASLRDAGIDARVVVTHAEGPNAKADQLARAVAAERAAFDVVVVVDSDVELTASSLASVLAPLADADVAAAWAPPVEVAPSSLGDRASAAVLGASLHAFALVGALDPDGLVGKVFAIRAAALEALGGFAALRTYLGEDMEIARRLRAAGLRFVRVHEPARSLASGRTLRGAVARYARWIAVIRAQRPHLLASYPLLFASTIPALALGAAAVMTAPSSDARAAAGAVIGFVVALRLAVAALARARSGAPFGPLRLVESAALSDVVLLAAFARALFTTRVKWRGRELRITRGGELALLPAARPLPREVSP